MYGLFSISCFAAAAAADPVATDWPFWRGPTHDSHSAVTGIKKTWTNDLKMVWQATNLCSDESGKIDTACPAAPAIQGVKMIALGRSDSNDLVFCMDANNGTLLWKQEYATAGEICGGYGIGPRAMPWIDGKNVYTFGAFGQFSCWALADGKKLWQRTAAEFKGLLPGFGFQVPLLVSGETIFIAYGGETPLAALNKNTGELLWVAKNTKTPWNMTIVNVNGARQLLACTAGQNGGSVEAFDPMSGKSLWNVPLQLASRVTSPTVAGSTMVLAVDKLGCTAFELGSTGAKELWNSTGVDGHTCDPVLLDGFVYFCSEIEEGGKSEKTFTCLDLKTGVAKWSTSALGSVKCMLVDGCLLCIDNYGTLFLVDANPAAFKLLATKKGAIPANSHRYNFAAPVVANGKLYLRYNNFMRCYDLMN
jgi:outer membrane protein assembly factor BamB